MYLGETDFLIYREIVRGKCMMQEFTDQGTNIVVSRPRHERGDERR